MPGLLIVEDESDIRQLLAMTVRSFGPKAKEVRIFDAATAEDAVKILALEDIDVVLTDHRLGTGVNGGELLAQVRARWPKVRRILMTGFSELPADEAQVVREVAQDILRKPMDVAQIRRVLAPSLGL